MHAHVITWHLGEFSEILKTVRGKGNKPSLIFFLFPSDLLSRFVVSLLPKVGTYILVKQIREMANLNMYLGTSK